MYFRAFSTLKRYWRTGPEDASVRLPFGNLTSKSSTVSSQLTPLSYLDIMPSSFGTKLIFTISLRPDAIVYCATASREGSFVISF